MFVPSVVCTSFLATKTLHKKLCYLEAVIAELAERNQLIMEERQQWM